MNWKNKKMLHVDRIWQKLNWNAICLITVASISSPVPFVKEAAASDQFINSFKQSRTNTVHLSKVSVSTTSSRRVTSQRQKHKESQAATLTTVDCIQIVFILQQWENVQEMYI